MSEVRTETLRLNFERCLSIADIIQLNDSNHSEIIAMATVQIPDEKKYVKAISLLYGMGGMFSTKPTRRLVISPLQIQALQNAGVLPKSNGVKKRGKKKAERVQPGS